jgi:hypothetical protein
MTPAETPTQSAGTTPPGNGVQSQVPGTGTITVNSNPDDADLYVDNSFVCNAPAVLKLTERRHVIRISMAGYKDWTRDITVLAGSEVKLSATLKKQN